MIDMANALATEYEQVIMISNSGGIFAEDTCRLSHPAAQMDVPFITRSRIANIFSAFPKIVRQIIALLLVVFEPLFFVINTILFVLLIRKLKPAMILSCNGGYPAAQACLAMVVAGRLVQVPVALSIVSMPARRRFIAWIYEIVMDKLVWKSASVVVVNAKNIADALSELRDAPIAKIRVIYNGLEDKQAAVIQTREKGKQIVIGCIARMDKAKGALLLFEAFAHLAKSHPEMQLVLAGQGDASAELARRTEVLGLQNKVQLLGHYDGDVSALLGTFDIYVFPSLWEGFPYSIVEALRSACVIVATRVGGIPEAVTEGVEGLLIAPGSKNEIIAAIEKLIVNQDMCQMLAKNARSKFERELTLSKMHLRVREVFAGFKVREALWH